MKQLRGIAVAGVIALLLFSMAVGVFNFIPTVDAAGLLASYTGGASLWTMNRLWNNSSDLNGGAETFTINALENQTLTTASFQLNKWGSPTGQAHAVVYNGTWISVAISDDFDVSTLTTSDQWINFSFSGANRTTMQPNTTYIIAYQNPISGTVDSSNFIRVGRSSVQIGTPFFHYASWQANSGFTFNYMVWGYDPDSPGPSFSSVSVNYVAVGTNTTFNAYGQGGAYPVSHYIFSQNNNGSWVNSTATAFSSVDPVSGNAWVELNMILNGTTGQEVDYQFYCNDTTDVWGSSGIYPVTLQEPVTSYVVANTSSFMGIRWQQKMVPANGRWWVFYLDGTWGFYSSSADTLTWDTPVNMSKHTMSETTGENIQAIVDSSGNIHVFFRVPGISYRVGVPFANGTLTWLTDWQMAWASSGGNCDFYGALDSYDYPWIAWGYEGVLNSTVYVSKSDLNNGTWLTSSGWPQQVANLTYGTWFWTNDFLVPLSNGQMYVGFFKAQTGGKTVGKLWNGNSWGSDERICTSSIVTQYSYAAESWSRTAVADSDDNIYFAFVSGKTTDGRIPEDLVFVKRDADTGTWSSETIINSSPLKLASPGLALNELSNSLILFWIYDAYNIVYRQMDTKTDVWDSQTTQIAYENNTIPYFDQWGYDGKLNSFPATKEYSIGLLWMANTTTQNIYDINIGFFDIPALRILPGPSGPGPSGLQISSSQNVLFKVTVGKNPAVSAEIRVYDAAYNQLQDTYITEDNGEVLAYLQPGGYNWVAKYRGAQLTGSFFHVEAETVKINFATGESTIMPTLDRPQLLKIGIAAFVLIGAVATIASVTKGKRL